MVHKTFCFAIFFYYYILLFFHRVNPKQFYQFCASSRFAERYWVGETPTMDLKIRLK